jgi:hypothetical protein
LHTWIAKKGTINPMFEGIEDVFIDWHRENKIIYRLADVYLMAAEAENELNGPTNNGYR